ncbi:protein of unknown function (plasmid) [Azospirillum lipoferum 4B]|uniref:Uncharacterized protein n=1 Tax=Azospirillum lipoferum (strain 4B) TaxID=862719 RepID=G7ZFX5_AZOL4|nr:protein of unknown function [Azospirillum lipoferum 4B]
MVAVQKTRAGCPMDEWRSGCHRQNCIGNRKHHVKTFVEPIGLRTVALCPYRKVMTKIENMCLQVWRQHGTVRFNQ